MDIYEALDKLKQNKRIDRTARRRQLVEKKLNDSVGKKPVNKLNESATGKKSLTESDSRGLTIDDLSGDAWHDAVQAVSDITGIPCWGEPERWTKVEEIAMQLGVRFNVDGEIVGGGSIYTNESLKEGKKLNERIGSRYSAENVDELIQHYIESWILDAKVYCDDIRDYLESEDLDPEYLLDSAEDGRVYRILDHAVDMLCDYYAEHFYGAQTESLSEATHRYATKWAVVKLGYYDNGKGNGGLLYDKKKDEIVKEFEGEGKGSTADNDAYKKATELADKLNKKEGKLSNGKNRYEAKPMNTKTTKL